VTMKSLYPQELACSAQIWRMRAAEFMLVRPAP
jgi:hypothetical protein